jgi:hypothetical protein
MNTHHVIVCKLPDIGCCIGMRLGRTGIRRWDVSSSSLRCSYYFINYYAPHPRADSEISGSGIPVGKKASAGCISGYSSPIWMPSDDARPILV